jgi:DNA helicase HerA-like ATPase
MNIQYFISLVAVLAAGGIITCTVAYYFIKNDIQKYFSLKSFELKKEERAHLLPLRLQAHERIIVFVERLNPSNLFIRLHQQGISAAELQSLILNEIRAEYQHNVTQQLYVNAITWNVIRKLKEDTLAMVNNAIAGMPAGATGVELSKKVLQHMGAVEENPYDLTLELIKRDIHQLF